MLERISQIIEPANHRLQLIAFGILLSNSFAERCSRMKIIVDAKN